MPERMYRYQNSTVMYFFFFLPDVHRTEFSSIRSGLHSFLLFFFLTPHLDRQDVFWEKMLIFVGKTSDALCCKETSVAIHLLWLWSLWGKVSYLLQHVSYTLHSGALFIIAHLFLCLHWAFKGNVESACLVCSTKSWDSLFQKKKCEMDSHLGPQMFILSHILPFYRK